MSFFYTAILLFHPDLPALDVTAMLIEYGSWWPLGSFNALCPVGSVSTSLISTMYDFLGGLSGLWTLERPGFNFPQFFPSYLLPIWVGSTWAGFSASKQPLYLSWTIEDRGQRSGSLGRLPGMLAWTLSKYFVGDV